MNKKIQKIIKHKTTIFCFVLLVFFVLCISGTVISQYSEIETQTSLIDNSYWDYEQDLKNNKVIYTKKITKDMLNKSILFYTEHAYVDIVIEDKIQYHFGTKTNIANTPGMTWTLYHIENPFFVNKNIQIELTYAYQIPKDMPQIYIGNSSTLSLSRIKTELPDMLINVMLFSISSLLIFCYIQNQKYKFDKKASKENLCYGILGILLLLISNCTLFSVQLLFPNGLGQYFLFYLSFFAIPLVTLLYIEGYVKNNLNVEFSLHLFVILLVIFLQIFHIKDFVDIIPYYFVYILIEFLIIIYKIYKTCEIKKKSLLIFTVFSFLLFLVLSYYIQDISFVYKSKLLLITKIIFLLFVKLELFFFIKKKIADSKNMYHNAYIDTMTGVGNRNLLYREIKRYKLEDTCIIFFDLNNLKYCNDTFGHNYGDILIKNAAKIICDTYGDEFVYRIGGDEFVVLRHKLPEETLIKLRNTLFKKMKEYNSLTAVNNEPHLEIACGFASYQKGDKKHTDIIDRADKIMYENKIYVKSTYKNKVEKETKN